MENEEIYLSEKNEGIFYCPTCDFKCSYLCDWKRHKDTRKHTTSHNGNKMEIKNTVKYKYENYVGDLEKQTYISKIGIYDENKNLIAIAKLARPIKKSENRSLTFKLKLDI
jgi:hypothetical protein